MNRFDYVRPATVAEAVAAAAEPGAAYLAAGTNLLDLMKGGVAARRGSSTSATFPGSTGSRTLPDGGVRIGALVRNADLAHDPTFARRFPAVAEALLSGRLGAAAQCRDGRRQSAAAHALRLFLRRRQRLQQARSPARAATRAAARTGCTPCSGWSESCIATHPSDFCVPLVALDAVVEIEGRAGRREVPLESFHRLPGDTPERESVLEPGELIVAVRLPAEAARFAAHARYLKLRERTSYAFAVVSAAAALRIEDGIDRARRGIALGGVAPKPWRARAAEAVLAGAAPGCVPPSVAPPRRRSPTPSRPATTPSRSSSRAGSWRARSRSPRPGTPERMPALPGLPVRPVPGVASMPEIALTQAPAHRPARLEYRPAAHPPRRRPQGHRRGPLRRRQPSARHALRRPGGEQHRARPRRLPRCCGGESASRRRRGDDAGATGRRWRRIRTRRRIPSCSGSTCCRTTGCATPTSRSRW